MQHIDDESLVEHLRRAGFEAPQGEVVRIERAGEGNINFVRRVRLGAARSVVVKHARPALERFPEYQAPVERLVFEERYTRIVEDVVGGQATPTPRILHFNPDLPWLVLEDLGPGPDLHDVLRNGPVPLEPLHDLGHFLGRVHRATALHAAALIPRFRNTGMQELHGEHIFTLPYAPNAFPVAPETRAAADALRADVKLRERIQSLRSRYYGAREALVHADVQSSNLLLRDGVLRLIDAEIAHVGDPAFDLGTALAHVHVHLAQAAERVDLRDAVRELSEGYVEGGGTFAAAARAQAYAGIELLRRTIGAARFRGAESPTASVRILAHGGELIRRAELD